MLPVLDCVQIGCTMIATAPKTCVAECRMYSHKMFADFKMRQSTALFLLGISIALLHQSESASEFDQILLSES